MSVSCCSKARKAHHRKTKEGVKIRRLARAEKKQRHHTCAAGDESPRNLSLRDTSRGVTSADSCSSSFACEMSLCTRTFSSSVGACFAASNCGKVQVKIGKLGGMAKAMNRRSALREASDPRKLPWANIFKAVCNKPRASLSQHHDDPRP